VTVCIAAINVDNYIFGIADRMVTTGDVEFEPPAPKILGITSSVVMMTSDDDGSLSAEIFHDFRKQINRMLQENRSVWLEISSIVDLYIRYRNFVEQKRAEREILHRLGLRRLAKEMPKIDLKNSRPAIMSERKHIK
jgi:hypothetical protein